MKHPLRLLACLLALAAFTPAGNFNTLGWSPEGQVFFNYAVNYASATPSAYTITAAADIDGDTINQVWGYVKPVTGTQQLPGVSSLPGNTFFLALENAAN